MAQPLFYYKLHTTRHVAERETLERLWRRLADPLVGAVKFDAVERARRPFSETALAEALELAGEEGELFVRGRDGFVAQLSTPVQGIALWRVWLDAKAVQGKRGGAWIDWLLGVAEEHPALFGLGCSVAEYDAKHKEVTISPRGVQSIGAVGKSNQEFLCFLPGIYWLTLFGAELVETFGAELARLPGTRARPLAGGQFAVQLEEPVLPGEMDARLGAEAAIAERLGEHYFFDRAKVDRVRFVHTPALAARLAQLEG
jgi:hypothetical protein